MSNIDDVDREHDLSNDRCLKIRGNGTQCPYKAVKGSKYCAHHGGMIGFAKAERRAMYATRWQAQIQEKASHPDLLSLNEEIGITRMTLENVLGSCGSELELVASVPQIQKLVNQVQSLVTQCDKIQRLNSNLLTEAQLVELALKLGEAVAGCIEDEDTINRVRSVIAEIVVGVHTDTNTIDDDAADIAADADNSTL